MSANENKTGDRVPSHAARRRPAATDHALVVQISAVLFRHDPIGLNFETNTDEYDSEAEAIVVELRRGADGARLPSVVHATFVVFFAAEFAGAPDDYVPIADEIWALWREHTRR